MLSITFVSISPVWPHTLTHSLTPLSYMCRFSTISVSTCVFVCACAIINLLFFKLKKKKDLWAMKWNEIWLSGELGAHKVIEIYDVYSVSIFLFLSIFLVFPLFLGIFDRCVYVCLFICMKENGMKCVVWCGAVSMKSNWPFDVMRFVNWNVWYMYMSAQNLC